MHIYKSKCDCDVTVCYYLCKVAYTAPRITLPPQAPVAKRNDKCRVSHGFQFGTLSGSFDMFSQLPVTPAARNDRERRRIHRDTLIPPIREDEEGESTSPSGLRSFGLNAQAGGNNGPPRTPRVGGVSDTPRLVSWPGC